MTIAPRMLLTMGDAAGIGPEIIVRAAQRGEMNGVVVVGEVGVLLRALQQCGDPLPLTVIASPDAPVPAQGVALWQPDGLSKELSSLPQGQVHAACGAAAARCIEASVRAIQQGQAWALVTAPIHKEALAAAGVRFAGHTDMLQALAGGAPVRMMLANDELSVVLVTIHMALRDAIDAVTFDSVLQSLRIAQDASAGWGKAAPRIAVAGLNPHAGEGGLFGREELTIIAPAIAAARQQGIDAQGPFAPDTVFMRARRGEFDIVIAMTHDHGLIPVKYLGIDQGVNVTLGLPFVRTSPDHGTAFDIAGQGIADPSSLIAALRWANRHAGGVSGVS
jgi:4-hydroxythreonine-4-phosphate dehydrogenase